MAPIDYQGLAQHSRERLAEARMGRSLMEASEVKVAHNTPDGSDCEGLFVVSYVSWAHALRSEAMEKGGVGGVCQGCGLSGFVGRDMKLVNLGGQN